MKRLSEAEMAREVALDLDEGAYVNLGIGLPTLVAGQIPADKEVIIHSENGVVGVGPRPLDGEEDWDLVDAGKLPVTLVSGGAYVSHVDSFSMIRGGHLDVAVMGAFQVSSQGDLANWSTGSDAVPGVGGAMDLAAGARQVLVLTRHTDKSGTKKLVDKLSLPLTGLAVVTRVYTDLGIFEPAGESFRVLAITEGLEIDELQQLTGAPLDAASRPALLPRAGR